MLLRCHCLSTANNVSLLAFAFSRQQGSKWEKINAGMVALPSFPSSLNLALFWPLIDANISDQLPKSHKIVCKACHTSMSFFRKEVLVCFPGGLGSLVCHTGPYRPISSPARHEFLNNIFNKLSGVTVLPIATLF